jgi:SAM-dependent methyltransferase
MPPAPPTQSDSIDEIPIVTDEPPPSSGEIEIDDDARPTKPAVLKVPEPKLVPAQAAAFAPSPPAASTPPRVEVAAVHTAVTPVASAVATAAPVAAPALPSAGAPPVAVANALSPAVVSTAASPPAPGPIAPSPPRVVSVAPASPQVSIKDLPPMRSLAPTEPEGLEVHFEDEDPPVSSPRTSEPEAEIAAEDLVSVESAPGTAKQVPATNPLQTETPVRAFIPPVAPGAAPPPAGTPAARGSLPPPPSAAAKPAAAQKPTPRVIVPTSSPLAPPPMSESAPTGRRKARPWWEELFNDDFIRTMAKITDAQIAKEVDFVEESLAVAKGAMLLDLGCGTGRHAIELTRRGYKVVGFDLSLPMLAKAAEEAQERSQKLNFVQGDMREMTFEDTFDGIYCWNTSFGFFEEEKNAQVIQRVHKALKKGGQFMLEVGNRDYIIRQAPSLAWFEGDGCICMDEMSIDWITSRMKVKRTMMMDDGRTKEIDYSVRIYSLHELGRVLHEAGFRVAEVSGRTGTPGVYFGNESPRTMILAEKK